MEDDASSSNAGKKLSLESVGAQVNDPDHVAYLEELLSANGLLDEAAETRHYSRLAVPELRQVWNHHFTPRDDQKVDVVLTVIDPQGGLILADKWILPRDQFSADLAREIFAPDAGMMTPAGRHLTPSGVDRIGEWKERKLEPADIAAGLRLDVDTVVRAIEALDAHKSQEIADKLAPHKQEMAMRYLFGKESWKDIVRDSRPKISERTFSRYIADFLKIYPENSSWNAEKQEEFARRGLDQRERPSRE